MSKIVNVPGLGRVRFPDSMSDEDIDAAIKKRPWEAKPLPENPIPFSNPSLNVPIMPPTMGSEMPVPPGVVLGQSFEEVAPRLAQAAVEEDPFAIGGKYAGQMGRDAWETGVNTIAGLTGSWQGEQRGIPRIYPPNPNAPTMPPEGWATPNYPTNAVTMEADLPSNYSTEQATDTLPPVLGAYTKAAQGFVESGPRLAAMGAMTWAGAPVWLAGGLSFGPTEQGLDPKAAAIGAALPAVGHGLAEGAKLGANALGLVEPLANTIGITDAQAVNLLKGTAATVGPAGGLLLDQLHTVHQMHRDGLISDEEAKKEYLTAFFGAGYNLGQGPMGVKWEKEPIRPPIIPQRRTQNMLREVPGAEHLNELERAHLDAERENVSAPIRVVKQYKLDFGRKFEPGKPTSGEVREEPSSDDPFAQNKEAKEDEGQNTVFMKADKSGTGEILIFAGEFQKWLNTVPERQRGEAVRRRLNEEELHLSTDPSAALEFWRSLTSLTRFVVARAYSGNYYGNDPGTGKAIPEQELAYEAVRLKLQQLDNAGPAEIAEAAFKERWKLRTIFALEGLVNDLRRRTFGNPNAAAQLEILTRVKHNLDVAKRTVEEGVPPVIAARRKNQKRLPYDERTKTLFNLARQAAEDPDKVVPQSLLKQWEQDQMEADPYREPIGTADVREAIPIKKGQLVMDLGPSERTDNASQDTQAAEVYGDVRPFALEGERQVPAQEGGPGVQPSSARPTQTDLPVNPAAMRKGVAEEKRLSVLNDAVAIYNRAIQEAKSRNDERGVQTLIENRQEILDRIDQLTGDQQSFPAARNKYTQEQDTIKAHLDSVRPNWREDWGMNWQDLPGDIQKLFNQLAQSEHNQEQVELSKLSKFPSHTDIPDTPEAIVDRLKAFGYHLAKLEDTASRDEVIKAYENAKKFVQSALGKLVERPSGMKERGFPYEAQQVEQLADYLETQAGRTLDEHLQDYLEGPGDQEQFPAARRKAEAINDSDTLRYGSYWMAPDTKLEKAERGHYEHALSKQMLDKESDISKLPHTYMYGKGWVRVALAPASMYQNAIFFEGNATPRQVSELKNLAIEKGYQLIKESKGARGQLLYDPFKDSPAGRRKVQSSEIQTGLDFEGPTSMTPKAIRGPVEGATAPKWAPITPQILEDSVSKHILGNPDPSFGAFAKMANDKWGISPGQLEQVWKGKMWDTLMKATGQQLTKLVFRLDLGGKLKMRKNLERMKAAQGTESGEAVRNTPSISSGENLVIANKMYGEIPDAPEDIALQTQLQKQLEAGELNLGVASMKKMRSTLKDAERRAALAKGRENEYNQHLAEAKKLRAQLLDMGFNDITAEGKPIGNGTGDASGLAKRLLHERIQMDRLADPDYQLPFEESPQKQRKFHKLLERHYQLREQLLQHGFQGVDEAGRLVAVEQGTKALPPIQAIGRELFEVNRQMNELRNDAGGRKSEREVTVQQRMRVPVFPIDEKGNVTSIHPKDTKAWTKQESYKVKVPEDEEMARPGFEPGLPPRQGSARFRAGQERRLRVISEIGSRLLEQQESEKEASLKREVTPDDVAYYRGPDAVRQIKPNEQGNVGVVGAIISEAPAPDRATVTSKTVGGEKVSGTKVRNSEAATRNLVAVEDVHNGRVYLLSAYEGGDGVVRVYDPSKAHLKRAHEALSPAFLRRYRPLWSLQLDQPVRDYMQRFENKDAFRREFIAETRGKFAEVAESQSIAEMATQDDVSKARSKLQRELTLGVIDQEQFDSINSQLNQRETELESKVGQKPGLYGRGTLVEQALGNPNVTEQEAGALWSALKLWKHDDPQQVLEEFKKLQETTGKRGEFESQAEQEARSKGRVASIALQKILRQLGAEGIGTVGAVKALLKLGENRSEFVKTIQEEFSKAPPPHEVGTSRRSVGEYPEPNPQELTMRSPEEIAQENLRRKEAGLKPLGAGLERSSSPEGAVTEYLRERKKVNNPAAIRKIVKDSVDTVKRFPIDPTGAFLRYYSGWMGDRLREGGGTRANEFADISNETIDRTKQLLGRLSRFLDPALEEVGKIGPTGTWLNGHDVVGGLAPNAAIGRTHGAIEGYIRVPAHAQKGVRLMRAANYVAGKILEAVTPGFKARGRAERHLTAFGYDMLRSGSGPLYESWLNGLAQANTTQPISTRAGMREFLSRRSEAATLFQEWREALNEPVPDMARIDRVNQEFKRLFKRPVTHVRANGRGIFGGWKEVIHSNAFNYLNATVKRAASTRAFREQFPNTVAGRAAFMRFRDDIGTEFNPNWKPGDQNVPAILDNFDALTRAMQGHPTDQYGNSRNRVSELMRPGDPLPDAIRFANQTMGNLMAKLVLTKQLITQTGELVAGSTPRYLGTRNYARAAGMLSRDYGRALKAAGWSLRDMASKRQLYQQMEQAGMVNRVIYDWAFDPKAPITSVAKVAGNAISKLFMENLLNETQESMAAATAKVVAERISTGDLSSWEKRMLPNTFKAMGFTPGEVNALMQGDPGMLDMFQRRAAAFLTGGNKHVAEGSRIGANRLFNTIFRFQSYPMMKANQLRKDIISYQEARTGAAKKVAAEQLTRNIFFNTLQGGITAGLAAMAGGTLSGNIKAHETADEPFKFLLESYLGSQSGPLYLLWRNMGDAGYLSSIEQAAQMIFPYAMFRELMDMANGIGSYKDQDLNDRYATFSRKKIPGMQPIRVGLAAAGLSNYNPDYNAARDAFYRWQRSEGLGGGSAGRPADKDEATFRKHMRKAQGALIADDREEYLNSVYDAVAVKGAKKAAASLRGRRLLEELSIEQKSKLERRIGGKAYNLLEGYDKMLGAAAESLNPPMNQP